MAYFEVQDFKSGLDVRRSRFTSVAGTLQKLVNAHITRGGDIERRKAFVAKGTLTPGTFGLASDVDGLVTFGSAAAPATLPDGIRYMRLQAPSAADMSGIAAAETFGGKLYVAADYADGSQWHFYDGDVVGDWGGGVARSYMVDNGSMALHLASLINGGGIYTATVAGTTITITGPVGVDYATEATDEDGGGNTNESLLLSTTQLAVMTKPEIKARAAFAVNVGREGAGQITQATVYEGATPVTLLGAPVPFTINARVTAAAVATEINNGFGAHGYSATSDLGVVTVIAPENSGAGANGRVLEITTSGEVCIDQGSFAITAGSSAPGANQVIMVSVDGKAAMSAPVDWTTSNSNTATLVAAAINGFASSPKISAVAIGETVYVSRQVVRSDAATVSIAVSASGTVGAGGGYTPPEGPPGTQPRYGGGGDGGGREGEFGPLNPV